METRSESIQPLWKAREAARALSISLGKFYKLVASGAIPCVDVPAADPTSDHTALRFDPADILRLREEWKRGSA